jgi:hypothetical protein
MSLCIFEFTTDRFEDLLFTINDNGVHNRVMDRIRSITKPKD